MSNPELEGGAFRQGFLLLLVGAISAVFLMMIQDFLMALLLAAICSGLCQPLYRGLRGAFRGRENFAALATIAVIVVLVVGPLTSLIGVVATQALEVTQAVEPWLKEHVATSSGRADLVTRLPLPEAARNFLAPYQGTILAKAGEWAAHAGTLLVSMLAVATKGTVGFFITLFVMLYAMFFFLKDGRAALEQILYYVPLTPEDEDRMVARFVSVARATLKGTLVIGVVQGGLAGVAFAVAGIKGAAFWGTVMALLSIIPGIGSALVWVPGVIYLLAIDQTFAGVALALWCGIVVGAADNVLRPVLVGKDTKMPDLLILISTLGGLLLFGAVGIVIGPIIAALFLTVWEIYGTTFKAYLPERATAGEDAA